MLAFGYTRAAVKPGADAEPVPFLTRNMRAFRVEPSAARWVADHALYEEHGAYIVIEAAALGKDEHEHDHEHDGAASAKGALGRKWLFLVFPRTRLVAGAVPPILPDLVSADHLSWVRGKSTERTPLHLHLTTYGDWVHDATLGITEGRRDMVPNYLPLSFDLRRSMPEFRDALLVRPKIRASEVAAPLWAAMRHAPGPGAGRGDSTHQAVGGATGGAGGRHRERGRRRADRARATETDVESFEAAWRVLPLRRLLVIGVRRGQLVTEAGGGLSDAYDFTVSIDDTMTHSPAWRGPAITFTLPAHVASGASVEAKVRQHAGRLLATHRWESFVEPRAI